MVANFGRKQKGKFLGRKVAFRAAGILFLIIIIVLVFADIRIYKKKKELLSQIENYKKQIEDIKKSSQNLKEQIANSDNQDYIEKIAYEQLSQQRPGEKQVIFITPEKKPEKNSSPENFWNIWLGWVSGGWQWIKNKF